MFNFNYPKNQNFTLSTTPAPQSPPENEKSTKRNYLWLLIAVILIVIIIVAAFVFFFGGAPASNSTQITFTAVNEHLIIYQHSSTGNQTITYDLSLNNYVGTYPLEQQITLQIPYSYQGETGTENITSMACTTSGFSLASISPQPPMQLPNTRDNETPITLTIIFNAPSTPYNGAFDFTVYYDQYV